MITVRVKSERKRVHIFAKGKIHSLKEKDSIEI